jgi:hypothetical protein
VVDALERLARDHTQRNLVRELLGLEIRMMREDPDVTELVRHHGPDLVVGQRVEEGPLEGDTIGAVAVHRRHDRNHQGVQRHDRRDDIALQ